MAWTNRQRIERLEEKLDMSRIPIQKIRLKPLVVKDPELKRQIREKLKELKPTGIREEQYCDYSYRFENGEENIIVKQYANGKLQFQGVAGKIIKLFTLLSLLYTIFPKKI